MHHSSRGWVTKSQSQSWIEAGTRIFGQSIQFQNNDNNNNKDEDKDDNKEDGKEEDDDIWEWS